MRLLRSKLRNAVALLVATSVWQAVAAERFDVNPAGLAADPAGRVAWVGSGGGGELLEVDLKTGTAVRRWPLPAAPRAVLRSPVRDELWVLSGTAPSFISRVDLSAVSNAVVSVRLGHHLSALQLVRNGRALAVADKYLSKIYLLDKDTLATEGEIPTVRFPVALQALNRGARLYVLGELPPGPADLPVVSAEIDVIDVAQKSSVQRIPLYDGSHSGLALALSPDERFVWVAHTLGSYQFPTSHLERGWMNASVLTLIDTFARKVFATVYLDDPALGAANPWGLALNPQGASLAVAHAGTGELSLIPTDPLIQEIRTALAADEKKKAARAASPTARARPEDPYQVTVSNDENGTPLLRDLSLMTRIGRERIAVPGGAPRDLVFAGDHLLTLSYFSGTLVAVPLARSAEKTTVQRKDAQRDSSVWLLGPQSPPDSARQGEAFFANASLCFQGWQSCISCHPGARADGLNWDLLNDGVGNPKNARSMLFSMQTPPVMGLGVRDRAETAVRAGIRYIQFAPVIEAEAAHIDTWLRTLRPGPSPYWVDGKLSPAAERGRTLFESAGCITCHPPPYYTNLKQFDVGTGRGADTGKAFDVPTLTELWRTGPYLHDGRARTVLEVLRDFNHGDLRGSTSGLSEQQIADLVEYLLSL